MLKILSGEGKRPEVSRKVAFTTKNVAKVYSKLFLNQSFSLSDICDVAGRVNSACKYPI